MWSWALSLLEHIFSTAINGFCCMVQNVQKVEFFPRGFWHAEIFSLKGAVTRNVGVLLAKHALSLPVYYSYENLSYLGYLSKPKDDPE